MYIESGTGIHNPGRQPGVTVAPASSLITVLVLRLVEAAPAEPSLPGVLLFRQPLNSPTRLRREPDAGQRKSHDHLVGDPGSAGAVLVQGGGDCRRRKVGGEQGERQVAPLRPSHLVLDDV